MLRARIEQILGMCKALVVGIQLRPDTTRVALAPGPGLDFTAAFVDTKGLDLGGNPAHYPSRRERSPRSPAVDLLKLCGP